MFFGGKSTYLHKNNYKKMLQNYIKNSKTSICEEKW